MMFSGFQLREFNFQTWVRTACSKFLDLSTLITRAFISGGTHRNGVPRGRKVYYTGLLQKKYTLLKIYFKHHIAHTHKGEERKVCRVLVGKPEGKRPLGRPRRRWEDGIRMDLREIGLGGVDWIRLSQDRDRWRAVASAVMNLRVLAPRS
jgi:hypothetical protein